MKLWFSGETFVDIDEAYSQIRKEIEKEVNAGISKKSYGKGLKSWDVIPIILPKSLRATFPEVAKYRKKDRDAEFRLFINYTKFKKGTKQEQRQLLLDFLRRTLDYMEQWNIEDFDVAALRRDFEEAVG